MDFALNVQLAAHAVHVSPTYIVQNSSSLRFQQLKFSEAVGARNSLKQVSI